MDSGTRERFWKKVNKTNGCWLWTASKAKGYGKFYINGRYYTAHRLAWEEYHGIIFSNLFLCHHCDVRACVRPDHLFLGTQKDNLQDMVSKGRHATTTKPENTLRGEEHGRAKLTNEQVIKVVELRKDGGTHREIAESTQISLSSINSILSGASWLDTTGLEKNRGRPKGESHSNSLLDEAQVLEIIKLHNSAVPQSVIVEKMGVDQTTISGIVNGRSWNWLTGIQESRGRLKGSSHHNTALDESRVLEIVALHDSGMSRSAIVKAVGVSQSTVGGIVTGRTWSWLTGIEKRQ